MPDFPFGGHPGYISELESQRPALSPEDDQASRHRRARRRQPRSPPSGRSSSASTVSTRSWVRAEWASCCAATHLELGQRVAIKVLTVSDEDERRDEARERFLREGRATAALVSDHVVRVYDVGTLENGAPFMVMELLRGQDLARTLLQHGPLSIERACDCVRQAAEAIACAHAQRHRASRLEAFELVFDPAQRRHAAGQGARFRNLQDHGLGVGASAPATSPPSAACWARLSTCRRSKCATPRRSTCAPISGRSG